jgi:hypothetical protein
MLHKKDLWLTAGDRRLQRSTTMPADGGAGGRLQLRYMREYIAMKTQFISPSPLFPNILTAPPNFNLADYFCRRMGITLAHVVHIPLWSWFFFLCLVFIFFGLEQIMISACTPALIVVFGRCAKPGLHDKHTTSSNQLLKTGQLPPYPH